MSTWDDVARELERSGAPSLTYPKADLPDPESVGAYQGFGWPRGQKHDYRWPPDVTCSGLHVHEYDTHYEVHVDRVHPQCSPLGHLRHDLPAAWMIGSLVTGAVIGRVISGSLPGTCYGAAIGLFVGAATIAPE